MVTKLSQLYLDTRKALLATQDFSTASLMTRDLLAKATGKTREEVLLDLDTYLMDDVCAQVNEDLAKLRRGVPFAYVLGEWEFYGLPLYVNEHVLIPRDDTVAVAELAINKSIFLDTSPRILDLCTGTGCIGLAVAAQVEDARVLLGEIDDEAIKICKQNTRRNNLTARVTTLKLNALEKPSRQLGEFDCIVSNPPYIPTADIDRLDTSVKDHEPHRALDGGEDGLDFYRAITDLWRDALVPGGLLAFEVGIGQADEVLRIMRAKGFGDLEIIKDLHFIPRVVYGRLCSEI